MLLDFLVSSSDVLNFSSVISFFPLNNTGELHVISLRKKKDTQFYHLLLGTFAYLA
jgi:hypothetical protein